METQLTYELQQCHAKALVTERVYTLAATVSKFAIPAGDLSYRVDARFEFGGMPES